LQFDDNSSLSICLLLRPTKNVTLINMKKFLLVSSLVLGGLAANAQSDFKPVKGDVTTEFGLSGGVLSSNFNLNEAGQLLRGRYFFQEKTALRLGFGLTSTSETDKVYGATPSEEGNTVEKETALLLNLGVEKHFTGTDRLSPYVGGDLLFGYGTTKETYENRTSPTSLFVDNASGSVKGPNAVSFGLRGVIGADYYFTKRVFLGVEGGFGFTYAKNGKTEVSNTTAAGVTTDVTIESTGNEFEIKPSVITGVRIGFVF
jgi:outer membrane protein W